MPLEELIRSRALLAGDKLGPQRDGRIEARPRTLSRRSGGQSERKVFAIGDKLGPQRDGRIEAAGAFAPK